MATPGKPGRRFLFAHAPRSSDGVHDWAMLRSASPRRGLAISWRRLDIIGLAPGKAGEVGYQVIADMAKAKATKASIPLNPGTSHWPMSGQRLVAELVGASEIGVEARESGVLHPFKSIAFAVALGDDVLTPAEGSSCDYCDRRDLCRA
jgi:hypothetical protein